MMYIWSCIAQSIQENFNPVVPVKRLFVPVSALMYKQYFKHVYRFATRNF